MPERNAKTIVSGYIRLMRPEQYVKNIFIYLPLFFGQKISRVDLILQATAAFVIFSIIASAIYIFNDIHDVREDRQHPEKKDRPLAAGTISKNSAVILMILLMGLGVPLAYLFNPAMFYLVLAYIAVNALYTLKLKHVPIVDIFAISTGFIIRIFIGGTVTNITLSSWMIIMVFLLSLFLAVAKRRDDVLIFMNGNADARKNMDKYNLQTLDASMIMMAAVIIVSYIMYALSEHVISIFHTDKLFYTVVFVMLGIIRYLHLTFTPGKSSSPTMILLHDRFLQVVIACWFITNALIIYVL